MPRICELFTNHLLDSFEPKGNCNEWCIPTPESRAKRELWDSTHDARTCWRAADAGVETRSIDRINDTYVVPASASHGPR